MSTHIILVNGLPGAGKTTVAKALAAARDSPLISKDAIKEAVAAVTPGVPSRALGAAASRMMWDLAAGLPGEAILDSWWHRPRDLIHVRAGLTVSGATAVAEVWCDIPPSTARARYAKRGRSLVHEDALRLADSWPEWSANAVPLGVGPIISVPTERALDLSDLDHRLSLAFQAAGASTRGGVAGRPDPQPCMVVSPAGIFGCSALGAWLVAVFT